MIRNEFILQATLAGLKAGKSGYIAAVNAKMAADTIIHENYATLSTVKGNTGPR